MGWDPVPVEDLEADPADVRRLAEDLRALAARLLDASAAFASGAGLPAASFDGLAGTRFRAVCDRQRSAASATSLDLTDLAGATDELARDLEDHRVRLQQVRGAAHEGGLEVGGAAVWPPHPTERHEDTDALRRAWTAYDRCWSLREQLEARLDAATQEWRAALAGADPTPDERGPVAPVVAPVGLPARSRDDVVEPPRRVDHVLAPAHEVARPASLLGHPGEARFDADSRARWVEGHRGRDGDWVHAHWQPVGRHGHGDAGEPHPHAGEHPSGATRARWVDGRWQPVEPPADRPRPPAIA